MIADDPIGAVMALVVYGYLAYLGTGCCFSVVGPGTKYQSRKRYSVSSVVQGSASPHLFYQVR